MVCKFNNTFKLLLSFFYIFGEFCISGCEFLIDGLNLSEFILQLGDLFMVLFMSIDGFVCFCDEGLEGVARSGVVGSWRSDSL